MYDTHRQAADQHELAAHAHRTAAEHNEKGKNELGNWHLQRALEHSDHAYKLAKEAHPNSPREPLPGCRITRPCRGWPSHCAKERKWRCHDGRRALTPSAGLLASSLQTH